MSLAAKIAKQYLTKKGAILPVLPSEIPMRERPRVLEKERQIALRDLNRASVLAYINENWTALRTLEEAKKKLINGVVADPGAWKILSDKDRDLVNKISRQYQSDWKLVGADRYVPDDLRFGQGRIHCKDQDYVWKLMKIKQQRQKERLTYKG